MFFTYALLMLLALPVTLRMVLHEPPAPHKERGRISELLRDRPLTIFLITAGLAATGISAGYLFLYNFLHSLGASDGLLGAVSAVGALAEVPLMLQGGRLIQKRGAPPVFAAGVGLFALGWGLYAILRSPVLALAIQVLNGAAMGLLWPAAVSYVAQRAPAGREATAQSLLSAMMYGVAPLLGTQLAGAIKSTVGARAVLGVAAGTMAVGMLLSILTHGRVNGHPPAHEN
jgi:MFS family permease